MSTTDNGRPWWKSKWEEHLQARHIIHMFFAAIVNSFHVWVTLIGFMLATMPLWHNTGQQGGANQVLTQIGNTILVAGVIGAFMRFVSTTKFMRNEFANLMYSKDFLKKPQNFDWALNNLLEASVNRYMPAIKTHLKLEHLKKNLPERPDLVYKAYSQQLNAKWADKARGVIQVDEETELTVETIKDHSGTVTYRYIAPDLGEKFTYEVSELTICYPEAGNKAIDKLNEVTYDYRGGEVEISYEIGIHGDNEHKLHRKMRRYVKLDQEPYIIFTALRYQLNTQVSFNCESEDISGYFTSLGTDRDFTTMSGKNKTHKFKELFTGLLLKGQGYTIYFCHTPPPLVENQSVTKENQDPSKVSD